MMNFNLGPLSIQASHLFLLSSLVIATAVGHWVGRRDKVRIGGLLVDMLVIGLIAARIAFVASWFELYRESPLSIIDIRDGGFAPLAGIGAALGYGGFRAYRHNALRNPLVAGVLAGAFAWFMSGAPAMLGMSEEKAVPQVTLATLDGQAVVLPELSRGRPMVVNLWATWCPPCRREMPVLAAAQQRERGITFVFANQREEAGTVLDYLRGGSLALDNVLLDQSGATGRAVGSSGMPTTLFYDAGGRLVDAHVGPVSAASLEAKLDQLRAAAGASALR
ncbi:redoxin family protein [Massilia sp. RP-1-19]|uniref:Redoxin family protein n=1 Tax=Massilia polaris TaxID=2728846 RepID=A0A848HLM0_9BURK|nr:TlpA disulfide reductase family protein [Massilia polaris]NML61937.1 redoxin family protein [Massilia polaris]